MCFMVELHGANRPIKTFRLGGTLTSIFLGGKIGASEVSSTFLFLRYLVPIIVSIGSAYLTLGSVWNPSLILGLALAILTYTLLYFFFRKYSITSEESQIFINGKPLVDMRELLSGSPWKFGIILLVVIVSPFFISSFINMLFGSQTVTYYTISLAYLFFVWLLIIFVKASFGMNFYIFEDGVKINYAFYGWEQLQGFYCRGMFIILVTKPLLFSRRTIPATDLACNFGENCNEARSMLLKYLTELER